MSTEEVEAALDVACEAEGEREPRSGGAHGQHIAQHGRGRVRRLLLRFLAELPEDAMVMEVREALE